MISKMAATTTMNRHEMAAQRTRPSGTPGGTLRDGEPTSSVLDASLRRVSSVDPGSWLTEARR